MSSDSSMVVGYGQGIPTIRRAVWTNQNPVLPGTGRDRLASTARQTMAG